MKTEGDSVSRSIFQQLGGESALRSMIEDFVDSVFDDFFIGFLFEKADRKRVKEKEYEHLASALGADVTYSGRDLRKAHRPHRIRRGQFERRLILLEGACVRAGFSKEVWAEILKVQEKHRPEILAQTSQC